MNTTKLGMLMPLLFCAPVAAASDGLNHWLQTSRYVRASQADEIDTIVIFGKRPGTRNWVSDPSRYRFMPRMWKEANPPMNVSGQPPHLPSAPRPV